MQLHGLTQAACCQWGASTTAALAHADTSATESRRGDVQCWSPADLTHTTWCQGGAAPLRSPLLSLLTNFAVTPATRPLQPHPHLHLFSPPDIPLGSAHLPTVPFKASRPHGTAPAGRQPLRSAPRLWRTLPPASPSPTRHCHLHHPLLHRAARFTSWSRYAPLHHNHA